MTYLKKEPGSPLISNEDNGSGSVNYISMEESTDEMNSEFDVDRPDDCCGRFFYSIKNCLVGKRKFYSRTVGMERGRTMTTTQQDLPANVIRNQKYNPWTFIFVVLYEQFKFFFNIYFLVVALTQFVPILRIGYTFTYVAPLVFVLMITIFKEAHDDWKRYKRDKEANGQLFHRLNSQGKTDIIPSSEIRVGDLIILEKDERIPADMILLRSHDKAGTCFVRTDQLDGETDWKLRRAVPSTQGLESDSSLVNIHCELYAGRPTKDIYKFIGNFSMLADDKKTNIEPLSIENTLWMNTVLASSSVIGMVIYTGVETRSVMNTSIPKTKVGLIDLELNRLAKVLFLLMAILSFIMVAIPLFKRMWYIDFFRFILLFSAIIPISLRVNLDMGKSLYSLWIMRDEKIKDTLVRTSTIPEELGRISYLLTDKTGTLTQNEMNFKKLHLGTSLFTSEDYEDIERAIVRSMSGDSKDSIFKEGKRSNEDYVLRTVEAIALCHNVTPIHNDEGEIEYQASSPDEIALVQFTESVGMTLWNRDLQTAQLMNPVGEEMNYEILNVFPFSSETKRMGIILRNEIGEIIFYMKGADGVMAKIVNKNDWLDEECGNMAREGLRTLVFGMKYLSEEQYEAFNEQYLNAKRSIKDRDRKVQKAVEAIEKNLELIGLTGVEDKLQENVEPTLESLRNAGIRIWMLTGDKIETATCIARSAKLVSRYQDIFTIEVNDLDDAYEALTEFSRREETVLVIDGKSLQISISNFKELFIESACRAPAVVCCRCSPTQKAEIVKLIKSYTKKQTCGIGDGGNDVSMIQAADVGIGIVGKEGKQASLAADFSVTKFCHINRLILWHGRNSYKRSASLSQFVIHRGLIISFIQAIFSAIFYFAAITIYNGWLLVGYSTVYTSAPVFSIVLDEDVSEDIAFQFPELYHELQKGRALSYKTFFIWVWTSIYQGGVIMLLSIFLFDSSMINIVGITFTTLIIIQVVNTGVVIHRWHWLIVLSIFVSLIIYAISIVILESYFDLSFILSWNFVWKVLVITAVASLPIYITKFIKRKCDPPSYAKL